MNLVGLTKNEKILAGFFSVIIAPILVWFVASYFTTPEPILYLSSVDHPENHCPNFFPIYDTSFKVILQNRAETAAISIICLSSSDNVSFNLNGQMLPTLCFNEAKILPASSGLQLPLNTNLSINRSSMPNTLTINITASCKYSIWSLVNKDCDKIYQTCNYQYRRDSSVYSIVS